MPLKPFADCRLYTFVDTAYLHGRAPAHIAQELCEGGADIIQLRAKEFPVAGIRAMAEAILPITSAAGVWFVLNDHPGLAVELGAPCCHMGQEDFFDAGFSSKSRLWAGAGAPVDIALGLSSHEPAQAQRAVSAGADYVAVGPVFPTGTKPGRAAVTLEYVQWARQNLQVPWFAIGGIDLKNLDSVLEAGAKRICVVSAILNRPDLAEACREFRRRLN
jgi:thiamine-phosphate pyrophosphorylase